MRPQLTPRQHSTLRKLCSWGGRRSLLGERGGAGRSGDCYGRVEKEEEIV